MSEWIWFLIRNRNPEALTLKPFSIIYLTYINHRLTWVNEFILISVEIGVYTFWTIKKFHRTDKGLFQIPEPPKVEVSNEEASKEINHKNRSDCHDKVHDDDLRDLLQNTSDSRNLLELLGSKDSPGQWWSPSRGLHTDSLCIGKRQVSSTRHCLRSQIL